MCIAVVVNTAWRATSWLSWSSCMSHSWEIRSDEHEQTQLWKASK